MDLIDDLAEGQVIEILADEEKSSSIQPEQKIGRRISLCNGHSDYEENFCPNCGANTERWTGWII